jgi:protein-S-isoprenylcysteine O-methyltransferase Ste14
MSNPTPIALVTLGVVVVCWLSFAAVFIFRRKPPQAENTEARRDRFAFVGIFLQMCGYALVWFQPPHAPFLPPVFTPGWQIGLSVFTTALAVASVWLVAAAVRTLGKQWAVAARLVEGHRLITAGPYAYVRNPIYTGMLGMLIATGLATEHFVALGVAFVLFMVGLIIRVRTEEKLLRSAFGAEFEEYARRVSAVIPGIY